MRAPLPFAQPDVRIEARGPDFSDAESQRVLSEAALAMARGMGREAAREQFAELIAKMKAPK